MFEPSKHLVLKMLEKPFDYDWSWQGFGMFRLYLSREVRLHVWAPSLATKNVTTLHTHPWHFESEVIVGKMVDHRYIFRRVFEPFANQMRGDSYVARAPERPTHHEMRIVCGPSGHACAESQRDVELIHECRTVVRAGERYRLQASDIHESEPSPGTVTIIRRTFLSDTEHASVFFPYGQEWVSAKPRAATREEIRFMAESALLAARDA